MNDAVEAITKWLGSVPGNVELNKDEARTLSQLIKQLYEDNRLIYNSEGDFARDD